MVLCYNLGMDDLLKYKMMLAAIVTCDYHRAADELLKHGSTICDMELTRILAEMIREG